MKFSAGKARRKWPCGGLACGRTAIAALAVLVLMLGATIERASAARRPGAGLPGAVDAAAGASGSKPRGPSLHVSVPLPRPHPVEAPARESAGPAGASHMPREGEQPAEQAAPAAPPASACRLALTEEIAIAPSIPDIRGPGGCGGEDLVRLEAVVLPDKRLVSVKPPAILRCAMASAVAEWIRLDMVPLATRLGTVVSDLDNFDSFECRGRNRVVGAQLSEHGRANALDVRAVKLANGESIALTDRKVSRELRESVLQSVCARFSTVLGPGSDWYHEDHIHLDLRERRNQFKLCQWSVWDPLPTIAPLMPPERPEEAPPRVVEAKSEQDDVDAARTDAAKSDSSKSAAREIGRQPAPARKKRR
ncbi:MAG: extensin family protein [Bradyrhizobium sp.]